MLCLAWLTGCHEHEEIPATSPCADRQQVSLPACDTAGGDRFSDEACIALDDTIRRSASTNDARAATITAPTEGLALPAATPFTFTWSAPTMALRRRPMTVGDELRRFVTLLPEAEAHCAPFTGRAYELRITAGGTVILRRQQSTTTWTPTAAEWAYITSTIGTRTAELTLYTATLVSNQVSAGAGPFYAAAPRRFTIAR
jgi:hypothetical protein